MVPPTARNAPTTFTMQKVQNAEDLPNTPKGGISILNEFGPTGTIFNTPITITVPHDPSLVHSNSPQPYFWDEVNGEWSTSGLSNVVDDESSDHHTIIFDATHLTVLLSAWAPHPKLVAVVVLLQSQLMDQRSIHVLRYCENFGTISRLPIV